jgi:hypothetical protein
VDYRLLNAVTIKNKYPLPRIDIVFDQLAGAQVFSKIDLCSGHHQIRSVPKISPRLLSLWDTSFMSILLCLLGWPMSGTFHVPHELRIRARVGQICRGLQWQHTCIFKEYERTWRHLPVMLPRLRDHQLNAKFGKCKLWINEVPFLGHVMSLEVIDVDPGKVRDLLDWEPPTSVTQVCSFLGLTGYYRRFIPNFFKISKPITKLL